MARTGPEALLSVADAAALLGVHPNTIRSWTDGGRLPAFRINARGDRRFRRVDVERILVEDAPVSGQPRAGTGPTRDAELALFERVASELAATPSPKSVARALVGALRAGLNVDRAAVYLVANDALELVAHGGFGRPPPATRPLSDTSLLEGGDRLIRLATRRGDVGALVVDAASIDRMTPAFMPALTSTAATSLASSTLLARARRELRRARALRAVTRELTGTLDLAPLLGELMELTRTLFEADKAGIWLIEGGEHPFRIAAHHGLADAFIERVSSLNLESETAGVRALRDRRARAIGDVDIEPQIGLMREVYAAEGIRSACLVPLMAADEPLGLLGLYHAHHRTWPAEEVALLQAFADQAAVAIQNARQYRSLGDQAARLRSIQDLSARLNGLTDVRAIAEAIVDEASTLADYNDIRVYRVDWNRRVCDPIAFTREVLDSDAVTTEELLRVEVGEGLTGWVAQHAEPLLINNASEDERALTIDGTDDVPESMLLVPMLYEGRTLGVIVLSQLGHDRFTTDDLQTMSIFAGYAAQAMANATTYGQLVAQSTELARRAESQRHLLETNERLLGSLDHADVLEMIADGLRDVVAHDNLSIYRTDQAHATMVPTLAREHDVALVSRYIIPFGRGLMGWAVEHGQPVLANDALHDPRAFHIPGTPRDPEAVIAVPLIADGGVIGALNVSRVGGPEVQFSESDFELVQLFAAQASIALRNADTHHAVSQRAEIDALTGLANHGAFQRELGRISDAIESGVKGAPRRMAVLMMDLDSFKAYNDRHGHPAGDALLHEAATAIYGAARSDDRVFRYGGDEFALILPGASVGQGAKVAERIRAAVAALTASHATPVTITVGLAGLPADAHDRSGLIEAADTALYYGKRSGENRVVRADQLPRDVVDLRGRLDELASAALLDGDDPYAVEHLVERATQLGAGIHAEADAVRAAVLAVTRSFAGGRTTKSGDGHADRVGLLSGRIADRLGSGPDASRAVELAGRLHALDDRAIAELAAIPSMHEVATTLIGVRALIAEGARRGRRAPRAKGRIGAHVIGAASAYDRLVSGSGRARIGRAEAMAQVRRDPATFRSDVLDALAAVVRDQRDDGRRRRAVDAAAEARGAA